MRRMAPTASPLALLPPRVGRSACDPSLDRRPVAHSRRPPIRTPPPLTRHLPRRRAAASCSTPGPSYLLSFLATRLVLSAPYAPRAASFLGTLRGAAHTHAHLRHEQTRRLARPGAPRDLSSRYAMPASRVRARRRPPQRTSAVCCRFRRRMRALSRHKKDAPLCCSLKGPPQVQGVPRTPWHARSQRSPPSPRPRSAAVSPRMDRGSGLCIAAAAPSRSLPPPPPLRHLPAGRLKRGGVLTGVGQSRPA